MSRVQQLRLRFEVNNGSWTPPRTDIILPTMEKTALRRLFRNGHAAIAETARTITIPQDIEVSIPETLLSPNPHVTQVSIAPLSPVQDRIKNFEGRLQQETNEQVQRKILNEKLLGNRLEAVMRRQETLKEKKRREFEEQEARKRWCVACYEEGDMSSMCEAPCEHWYCNGCLKEAFTLALSTRTELRCCSTPIPLPSTPSHLHLPTSFSSHYTSLLLELHTPNPLYCANSRCSAFLPPTLCFGPDVAHCVKCYAQTCRHCRDRAHRAGRVCERDEGLRMVRELMGEEGWRRCPACGNGVEREGGCLHITCRCMTEFCYRCGGYWKDCESSCVEGGGEAGQV